MNAPYSQNTKSLAEKLDYVEEIISSPDLTTPTLEVVLDVANRLEYEDISEQSDFNDILN